MGYGDFHLEVTASLVRPRGRLPLKVIALRENVQDHWDTSESEFQVKAGESLQASFYAVCTCDPREGNGSSWLEGYTGP